MAGLAIRYAKTLKFTENNRISRCILPNTVVCIKRRISDTVETKSKIVKTAIPKSPPMPAAPLKSQGTANTPNANSAEPKSSVKLATLSNFNLSDEPLPKLVVIGSGWGSTYLLHTTLISTTNYFLYTPLLAETASGTLESHCVIEPSRKLCTSSMAYFIEAEVKDVDFEKKLITAKSLSGELVNVPYDLLVISSGAIVNTFGIPGVEKYAYPLKTIHNSRNIRKKVLSNFEKADICDFEEERKRLLTFVVCGAGPTGVECLSELRDLINNDLIKYYPKLVKEYVKLILVEGADRILLAMRPENSKRCLDHLHNIGIEVCLNTLVSEIKEDVISCKVKDTKTGEMSTRKIPYGACIWSGGVGPSPLTKTLCEKLYPNKRTRALIVEKDLSLRNYKDVYAIGDCATFEGPTLHNLFEKVLGDSKTSSLPYSSFSSTFKKISEELPYKKIPHSKVKEMFEQFDSDKSSKLEPANLEKLCKAMNIRYTTLPPTAQVASQQGSYLADKLNRSIPTNDGEKWQVVIRNNTPFKYNHLGAFAYIGAGKSVLEFNSGRFMMGRLAFFVWKFSYLSKQISIANAYSVLTQWLKCAYLGRNVSHY